MRRQPIAVGVTAAALILLVVLGALTGTSAAPPAAPVIETAPVSSTTLVCPDINGGSPATTARAAVADVAGALSPPSQSGGAVTATVLAGAKSTTHALVLAPSAVLASHPKLNPTIAIGANGSVAASVVADQVTETTAGRSRGLSGVRCASPATDWWFAGADGRVGITDTLTLSNPATTAAIVSISLWGEKGPLTSSRLESIRVSARSAARIRIAAIAPDIPTVAVHVHATSGAVTAALADRRASGLLADGADFMPPTLPPARSLVVSGFAPGNGSRRLILADPGPLAATVGIRLVTSTGSFTPVGINQVVVPAGHTRVVALDKSLKGTTGAVELTSDQPVVAAGVSSSPAPPHRPDLMWLAATDPLVGSGGVATGREPDGGRCLLLLTAPQGQAQVRVSTPTGASTTITVPAGHSLHVDITDTVREGGAQATGPWPFAVTTIGSAPVYGVRVLSFAGAHGSLVTGEPLIALPAPIVLPPVRSDPRVATR
jgi:hypothetical protein